MEKPQKQPLLGVQSSDAIKRENCMHHRSCQWQRRLFTWLTDIACSPCWARVIDHRYWCSVIIQKIIIVTPIFQPSSNTFIKSHSNDSFINSFIKSPLHNSFIHHSTLQSNNDSFINSIQSSVHSNDSFIHNSTLHPIRQWYRRPIPPGFLDHLLDLHKCHSAF